MHRMIQIATFLFLSGWFLFLPWIMQNPLRAEEPSESWNLDRLVDRILEKSPLMEALEAHNRSSRESFRGSENSLWPGINASLQMEETDTYRTEFGVEISFPLQKILGGASRENSLRLEQGLLNGFLSREEIRLRVTRQYLSVYLLSRREEIFRDAEDFYRSHIRDIDRLLYRGVDLRYDRSRSEVERGILETRRKEVARDLQNALLEISSLAGRTFDLEELDFSGLEPENQKIYSTNDFRDFSNRSRVEEVLEETIQKTALWRMESLSRDLAENLYNQSRYYAVPSLVVGSRVMGYQKREAWDDDYQVYIAASLPVSDLYIRNHEEEMRRQDYISRKKILEDYGREFRLQIRQLVGDIDYSYGACEMAKKNVKEAKASVDLAAIQYRRGRIKEIDILDTYSRYLNTREDSIDKLRQFYEKNLKLSFLLKEYNRESL